MAGKRFGVVGVGLWGEAHARVYSTYPGARLAMVCDANGERAREVAERYGAERWTTDYRELAGAEGIDAVSVATPDFAHAEIAIAAARGGKHLLVEKPLATTVAEAEAMVAAARQAGVHLMVDFHNRWSPIFNHARGARERGELGRALLVSIHMSNSKFVPTQMLSWGGRSSVLWFLGAHALDLMCWLLGERPVLVRALSRAGVLEGLGVTTPDLYLATLEFPSGAVGQLEHVWVLPDSQPNLCDFGGRLVGSEGTIYFDCLTHRDAAKFTAKAECLDLLGAPTVQGEVQGFMVASIRHFADCVINGNTPLVSGEEGLAVTRVLCAIEEAAHKGQPVELAW